jgi:hypothetical protein
MKKKTICTKKTYNKDSAYAAKRGIDNCLLNVYKCENCNNYHLGRSNKRYRNIERIEQLLEKDKERNKKVNEKIKKRLNEQNLGI